MKSKLTDEYNGKNCSRVYAYHCAQLSYPTQHRTVLIIFPPDEHHSSDAVSWKGGGIRYVTEVKPHGPTQPGILPQSGTVSHHKEETASLA